MPVSVPLHLQSALKARFHVPMSMFLARLAMLTTRGLVAVSQPTLNKVHDRVVAAMHAGTVAGIDGLKPSELRGSVGFVGMAGATASSRGGDAAGVGVLGTPDGTMQARAGYRRSNAVSSTSEAGKTGTSQAVLGSTGSQHESFDTRWVHAARDRGVCGVDCVCVCVCGSFPRSTSSAATLSLTCCFCHAVSLA